MNSLSKKIRREKEKAAKKELQKKLNMFDKLGDECLACQKEFDKKSKEMAMTWSVVVGEDSVRLYCPTCWDKAKKIIEEIKDGYENSKSNV